MSGIILFDGECNICDRSVQFILKRDAKGYFKFASLQSKIGKELIHKYSVPDDLGSIVLIENQTFYTKSTAVLRICKHLDGLWKVLQVFLLVPRPIRNVAYELIAKNRYRWFGKKDSCMVPTPDMKERFL